MTEKPGILVLADPSPARNCYERVLHLTDPTVRQTKGTLRGEFLRWRDLVAKLYRSGRTRPDEHRRVLRCLLQFTPEVTRQIPFLTGAAR